MRKKNFNVHSIQEVVSVGDMARSMPIICTALEKRQADHQNSMVKIKGMIKGQPIFILIDSGASLSCLSPRILELCKLLP